jgi:hypothetical protein
MSTALDGGCACGEIRNRLASDPLLVHGCHFLRTLPDRPGKRAVRVGR